MIKKNNSTLSYTDIVCVLFIITINIIYLYKVGTFNTIMLAFTFVVTYRIVTLIGQVLRKFNIYVNTPIQKFTYSVLFFVCLSTITGIISTITPVYF